MAGRPPKPFTVLTSEKKSHRTKAELAQRKNEEQALLTGQKLKETKEVKENPVAHKEFRRVLKLLEAIQKNDAIYEQSINRYCLLVAECAEINEKRTEMWNNAKVLEEHQSEFEDIKEYFDLLISFQKNALALDKQLQAKRNMLLSLEKENAMTIASALRSIPKTPEKKTNALLQVLGGD